MTGSDYIRRLNQILQESPGSYWIDSKSSFDYLYEAAKDFAKEVKSFHSSQTITTVVSSIFPYLYPLNPDFMEILTQDADGNKVLQLTDAGGNVSWMKRTSYAYILRGQNTMQSTPTRFAVTDNPPATRITGTATSDGLASGGESVLIDTNADFSLVDVGADVINTTSGKSYIGVVLAVNSTTSLTTAMFNVATSQSSYAGWTSGDTYLIQPQAQYALVIDPPPSSVMTITVPYICKPAPVYSNYGSYSFATGYEEALIKYAFWLYKYRDSKPQVGDALYRYYDAQIRKAKNVHRAASQPKGFRVSFKKS